MRSFYPKNLQPPATRTCARAGKAHKAEILRRGTGVNRGSVVKLVADRFVVMDDERAVDLASGRDKFKSLMTEPPGHRAPAVGSRPPRGQLGWAVQDRLRQVHFQHHVAGGFRLYPQVAAAVADKPLQDP